MVGYTEVIRNHLQECNRSKTGYALGRINTVTGKVEKGHFRSSLSSIPSRKPRVCGYAGKKGPPCEKCVFQFYAILPFGKKLLDHVGNFLVLEAGRKLVLSATTRLKDFGFDVPNLHAALLKLSRLIGTPRCRHFGR
jgi:hypothetical protein